MLSKQSMRTFMCIHFMPIMYEQGIDSMEQCVIQPIGRTLPMLVVNHYHGSFVGPIGFPYFEFDNYPTFLIRKAHINTILSCSTFL